MSEAPVPSRVLRRELDFAASVGAILSYRIDPMPGKAFNARRVTVRMPDGSSRSFDRIKQAIAFTDGVRAATAATEEAIQ